MKENVIKEKSFAFAHRVVKLAKYLKMKKGNSLCLVSFFGMGRLEAHWCGKQNMPKVRRISMSIALKEANETSIG